MPNVYAFPEQLPDQWWAVLVSELVNDSVISAESTSEGLRRCYESGCCAVLVINDQPVGFVYAANAGRHFAELYCLWVHEKVRDHAKEVIKDPLGKLLFDALDDMESTCGTWNVALCLHQVLLGDG